MANVPRAGSSVAVRAHRASSAELACDLNHTIAGLLRDLADVQTSPQSRLGYKRAAAAIRNLDAAIESYLDADGSLRKIAHVGPSSTRVVLEVLRTGRSETVDRAVDASGRRDQIEKSRTLRGHFLTRAHVVAALSNRDLTGPSLGDYRGDLQMHSTWSDGSQSLEDIATTAISRGYDYAAVTDHSYGLPIAGGVPMHDIERQHREIDAINQQYRGRVRLLKGIEANIRADGTVDMESEELRRFELVVAAPHSVLRSAADQTERLLTAIRSEGVNILGHPRGRMYGSRPGLHANWPVVFAAAARQGVAIEIDGDPARQDVDFELARAGVAAGCLFALDSDAHGTADWTFAETAIAHARLAGVPTGRVINTWPLEQLVEWANSTWHRA